MNERQAVIDALGTKVLATVPEYAAAIGQPERTCYRAAERGELPTWRMGRRLYIVVPKLFEMWGLPHDPAPRTTKVARSHLRPVDDGDQLPRTSQQ